MVKQGLHSPRYKRNRKIVMHRAKGLCERCLTLHNRVTPAVECDHLMNRARQGSDNLDNLWALCKDCHAMKSAREIGSVGKAHDEIIFPTEIDPATGWPKSADKDNEGNSVDSFSYWKAKINEWNAC